MHSELVTKPGLKPTGLDIQTLVPTRQNYKNSIETELKILHQISINKEKKNQSERDQ